MYVKIIITGVHGYISNSIRKHFIETHKFNGGGTASRFKE